MRQELRAREVAGRRRRWYTTTLRERAERGMTGRRQRGFTTTQRESGGRGAVGCDAASSRDDATARHKRRW